MLLVKGSCETDPFRHLSEHAFRSSFIQKYITFEDHIFKKKVQTLIEISEMEKTVRNSFSFFTYLYLNWLR